MARMWVADPEQPRILGKDQRRTVFLLRHRFQKPPWDGGMILAVGTDRDDIQRVVDEDPLIDAGITAYEVTEWKTTMRSEDFEAMLDGLDP